MYVSGMYVCKWSVCVRVVNMCESGMYVCKWSVCVRVVNMYVSGQCV